MSLTLYTRFDHPDFTVPRFDFSPDQPRDEHGRFGSGGVGLETNDKGQGSEAPSHWDHEADGPLYHITYAKHLSSIARDGLDPNRGGTDKGIGANAGLGEHSKKSVFVTEQSGINFWRGRLEDHANDRSDDPRKDKLTPVTLRINQSAEVHHDHLGTADANAAAMMVREKIAPQHIEFYAHGTWHPIADHAKLDHKSSYDEEGYLKQDHDNPLAPHFDAFCDVMTRFDYSEDQPRDDHGRFGSGGSGGVTGLAKDTGTGSERVGAKSMSELGKKLDALHGGFGASHDSSGKLIRDDWGVSTYDKEKFGSPERVAVLEHVKDIVATETGIPQRYPIEELRIDKMMGANGMMTAAHDEKIRGADDELHTVHMPGRITIDPDIHAKALEALTALGENKKPDQSQIGGLHTYIHEMCHAASPMQLASTTAPDGSLYPSGYRAHGAIIEEVTTEVMARGVMANILRETPERGPIASAHSQIMATRAGDKSSYQPAIDWTMKKIREAVAECAPHSAQLSEKSVYALPILRDATQAYRASAPPKPYTNDQAAAQFAMHIGHAAVKAHPDSELHAGEVAERVRLQLRQVSNGPDADILQRFDALTMSRFDAPQQSVWTVPRNDIAAAMAISNPSPDEMGVLLMLQDNPELLLQALAKRSP